VKIELEFYQKPRHIICEEDLTQFESITNPKKMETKEKQSGSNSPYRAFTFLSYTIATPPNKCDRNYGDNKQTGLTHENSGEP
jgi:hypothetical protein